MAAARSALAAAFATAAASRSATRAAFVAAFSSARAAFSAAFSAACSSVMPMPKNSERRASVDFAAWLSASFFVRPTPCASPLSPAYTWATKVRSWGGPWVSTNR